MACQFHMSLSSLQRFLCSAVRAESALDAFVTASTIPGFRLLTAAFGTEFACNSHTTTGAVPRFGRFRMLGAALRTEFTGNSFAAADAIPGICFHSFRLFASAFRAELAADIPAAAGAIPRILQNRLLGYIA